MVDHHQAGGERTMMGAQMKTSSKAAVPPRKAALAAWKTEEPDDESHDCVDGPHWTLEASADDDQGHVDCPHGGRRMRRVDGDPGEVGQEVKQGRHPNHPGERLVGDPIQDEEKRPL
jgi:hypothetical protein